MRHWHGLEMCDVEHPGACSGKWGCNCSRCKDRKHPMDLLQRLTPEEIDAINAARPS